MPPPSFPVLLQQFFTHLRATQEVSIHTITAYRDTWKLLLHFIAKERRVSIDRTTFEAFVPETIMAFLEYLQKERHNTTRTHNARLAAIRAFVRFSLHEAARRLALTVEKASAACPSLRNRTSTLHSWRHTCAMHLLQAGVAIEIIALWLGHEQISTTHGYIEADLNMKKETLAHLKAPSSRRAPKKATSNILAFLEAL